MCSPPVTDNRKWQNERQTPILPFPVVRHCRNCLGTLFQEWWKPQFYRFDDIYDTFGDISIFGLRGHVAVSVFDRHRNHLGTLSLRLPWSILPSLPLECCPCLSQLQRYISIPVSADILLFPVVHQYCIYFGDTSCELAVV